MRYPTTIFCLVLPSAAFATDLVLDARPAAVKAKSVNVAFVPMVEEAPTLDGKLTEPLWSRAAVIREWQDRLTSSPAKSLRAEMRVVASKEFVYFGLTLHGTKGLTLQKPTPGTPGKDEYGGSVLEIFLDPNGKGRSSFQIVSNPVGLRYDKHDWMTDQWTGTWKSAAVVDEDSWSMEIAVPVSDVLSQAPGKQPFWKANFCLVLEKDNQQMYSWTGGWGDNKTDYGILYFGTREQFEQTAKPRLSLVMDRVVYDMRDNSAVALTRVDSVGDLHNQMSIQLSVLQGEKVVARQLLAKSPGADVDYTLDLRELSEGDYTLKAELLKESQVVASAERAFSRKQRKVQPEPVTAGKIPVKVHPQKDLAGVTWPITTGVPFSQGSLQSAQNVRLLDPSGKEVPVQTSVRSSWDRRGPVQWMGLDFIPMLAEGEQVFTLEYGPNVKAAASTNLRVTQNDDLITVNTGPLQFTVDRKHFALISSATIDGKQVLQPNKKGGLSLIDHEGNRYTSAGDNTVEVTVEEQGPLKATICAKGWYVKEGSVGSRTSVELPTDRLCLFTVRLSAFAGSPLVKMAVSTTVTFDTDKVRLRELTIGLPIQSNDIRIGDYKLADKGYLLQDRWDRTIDVAGKEHPRSEGWIETPDLRIAVRRFWQLFPKEIGYANGLLTIHPWPAHGHDVFAMDEQVKMANIYKLLYAHQGKELSFKFPAEYTKALDDALIAKPKSFGEYYKQMSFSNAQGLTIHNDLLLAFGPAKQTAPDGPTLSKLVNTDPHALPDSTYLCATGVLGPILHADPQFARLEETYKRGFLHLADRQEPNNEYGMFIFANSHTYWQYNPKIAGIHRVWLNAHYLIPRIPFVQYARSGDPSWMVWGHDNANTVRDTAMIHYVSPERSFQYHQLGAQYHVKGFAPWAGDAHVAAHPICLSYLTLDYYLFGNRRSLDAVHDWATGIVASSPGGQGTREGMTTMGELIEVYRLTWDVGLMELLDRYRNAVMPIDLDTWDYHPLLCEWDYTFSGDEKLLKAFREAVIARPNGDSANGNMHYAALFSRLDNDPKLLAQYLPVLYRDSISVLNRPGAYGDGLVRNEWYTFAYVTHKYPYLLKAMKQFGLEPKRPVATHPAPQVVSERRTLIVVNETSDQDIPVTITYPGPQLYGEIAVRVFRADGVQVAQGTRPAVPNDQDRKAKLTLTIPSDGKAAQYLIEVKRGEEYDAMLWPVTPLAQEIALLPAQKEILMLPSSGGLRLYAVPPTAEAVQMTMYTRSGPAMALELLDANGKLISTATNQEHVGGTLKIDVPAGISLPMSLYATGEARIKLLQPASKGSLWCVALDPAALFTPTITEAPKSK